MGIDSDVAAVPFDPNEAARKIIERAEADPSVRHVQVGVGGLVAICHALQATEEALHIALDRLQEAERKNAELSALVIEQEGLYRDERKAAEAREAALREALKDLYAYVIELEGMHGVAVAVRGGKYPNRAKEIGERVRAALATSEETFRITPGQEKTLNRAALDE